MHSELLGARRVSTRASLPLPPPQALPLPPVQAPVQAPVQEQAPVQAQVLPLLSLLLQLAPLPAPDTLEASPPHGRSSSPSCGHRRARSRWQLQVQRPPLAARPPSRASSTPLSPALRPSARQRP